MEAAAAPPVDENRAFRFCRLFPDLAKFQPDDAGLIALGQALEDPFVPGAGDSQIPAGFTYFGPVRGPRHHVRPHRETGHPRRLAGPGGDRVGAVARPGTRQRVRPRPDELPRTVRGGRAPPEDRHDHRPADLRRDRDLPERSAAPPGGRPREPKQAIIGDPRNDENLIVAQTHLAFLKFHNKVVDRLKAAGIAAGKLFEEARKTVVQHYQSIVLHDFVRRLADPAVFDDVLANGRKFYFPKGAPKGTLCACRSSSPWPPTGWATA